MSPGAVGWLLVATQFGLLATLVLVPDGSDWPTPTWLGALGWATVAAGATVGLVAARSLGSALTPTPEPRPDRLCRDGLYRHARHPIYSGVLLVVLGLTIRSGRWATLALAAVIAVFFQAKSRWEERRLHERYPEYAEYAASTPRFVPRPARRPGGRAA